MSTEMTAGNVSAVLDYGFKCRDCKQVLGTAKHYGLEMWQWMMLVVELGWMIAPTIVFHDTEGEVTETKEGYALCDRHNK